MLAVLRFLSLIDFCRTVDFIYIDFNLLPHMEKLPYSLFLAAFGQFLLVVMDISS